ncbi:MAG: hypothetical protein AAFX76_00240 [Planctomycetota bacterium]
MSVTITSFTLTVTGLTGCDGGSEPPASAATESGEPALPLLVAEPLTPDESADFAAREALSARLLALDYFAEQMWPAHEPEAASTWLQASAAGSGVTLDTLTAEDPLILDGVDIRPMTVKAIGAWDDLVGWLAAIEASPRRLVLRGVELNDRRDGTVADLRLAALVDRPTGLDTLAEQDVASLRGEALAEARGWIEAELRGKSRAFTELGADASWSRPIGELAATLPEGARPVRLDLSRAAAGDERAEAFAGRFTLTTPDAGAVPGYVRQLQRHDGFVRVGLNSLRDAGAGWQRVAVTFTYAGAPPSDVAADASVLAD